MIAKAAGRRRVMREEHEWRPAEMRGAELAYAERDFHINSPDRIVARVDRVYKRTDSVHVVTELKRRDRARVFESDRIELSVQRLAVAQSGVPVSDTGYVIVEGAAGRRTALPVRLLPDSAVIGLAQRFRQLMAGLVQPNRANRAAMCTKCAYRKDCRPDVLRS
ncbi:MAG TPA: PD-(D/E)XK nuclease family protein [Burkholderiaceae bacterium]|nr:PD-(D/E)XK nuclease family protein [Burkholderiaceae bacterium]